MKLNELNKDSDSKITSEVFEKELQIRKEGETSKVLLAGVEYKKEELMGTAHVNKDVLREIINLSSTYRLNYPDQFDKIKLQIENGKVAYYYDGTKFDNQDAFVQHLATLKK